MQKSSFQSSRTGSLWTQAIAATVLLGMGASAVSAAEPFTLVFLPDTQNYADSDANNNLYGKGQMRWIRDNWSSMNMKFVMHLGDLQNPGNPYFARTDDIYEPDFDRPTGNPDTDIRWRRADELFDILDNNNIPYSIVPGNHDYLRASGQYERMEPIYYLKYFGPQRYAGKPTFGGSSPADAVLPYAGMNTYHRFEAGGRTFLNLAIQFDPNDHDLRWAQKIINQNPGLPTIVTTHAFLNNSGYQPGYKNLWDDFVKNNPQVVMTWNGHITGEHRQTDTNIAGQTVHQVLVDYQATEFPDDPDDPSGFRGGGYLRTAEFDTDANLVRVKSYSPVRKDYLTDGDSQFNLSLNLNNRFGPANDQPVIQKSVSFRQGANGYSGTRDTFVDESASTTANGTLDGVWVDGDAGSGNGNQSRHGLIRFENLFSAAAIPDGARIESATLTLRTHSEALSPSDSTMNLYRMLSNWNESSTWDSESGGISANGQEAILGANATFTPTGDGRIFNFDVTESLFAWLSGAPNYGWAIVPGGNNGWQFFSSETGVLTDRPTLNVTYSVVPEPAIGAVVGMFLVTAGLTRRRRGR